MKRILTPAETSDRTGNPRTSLYQLVRLGQFPKPVRRGLGNCIGWMEHEVEAWIEGREGERVDLSGNEAA